KALVENKLSALIVRVSEGDNQNVLYLSGFAGSTAVLLITRSHAYIITDARYYTRAKAEAPDYKLVKVVRGKKVSQYINEALQLAGVSKDKKVGFEAMHIPVAVAKAWNKDIKAKLVPTVHLVERFRQLKDEAEIKLLRTACRATSRVYVEVAKILKAGMT